MTEKHPIDVKDQLDHVETFEKPAIDAVDEYDRIFTPEDAAFFRAYPKKNKDRAWRKVDWRLMPMLTLLYLCSYLDRANIGNAKIEGMDRDLGMTGVDYNTTVSIFFITYCLCQIPSNAILQQFFIKRPSRYITGLTVAWGIAMTCHGFVKDWKALLGCRLLMGIPEAGFFPAAVLIIATWYPREMVQTRMGILYTSSATAGALSGLLAFAIAKMDGLGGYQGWGLASVFVGILCPWLLIDHPDRAKWLDEDEKRFIKLSMTIQDQGEKIKAASSGIDWRNLWKVLTDYQIYTMMLIVWVNVIPNTGKSMKFTLPSIIRGMGFTSSNAQLMTIPVYLVGAVSAVGTSMLADKFRRRYPFVLASQFVILISFCIIFPLAPNIKDNIGPCYFALCFACLGFYPLQPGANAWIANNLAGPAKRSMGVAFFLTLSNSGGIIASFIFIDREAPRYPTGYGTSIAFAGAGIIAATVLELIYIRINKKRAQVDVSEYSDEQIADLGDRAPTYRYML